MTNKLLRLPKEQKGGAESRRSDTRGENEDDERRIAESIKASREQLAQVIQSWATVICLEQFLKGVEERTSTLSESQQAKVLQRLKLAREFIGTQGPIEFFKAWKTPDERYSPLAKRKRPETKLTKAIRFELSKKFPAFPLKFTVQSD